MTKIKKRKVIETKNIFKSKFYVKVAKYRMDPCQ